MNRVYLDIDEIWYNNMYLTKHLTGYIQYHTHYESQRGAIFMDRRCCIKNNRLYLIICANVFAPIFEHKIYILECMDINTYKVSDFYGTKYYKTSQNGTINFLHNNHGPAIEFRDTTGKNQLFKSIWYKNGVQVKPTLFDYVKCCWQALVDKFKKS